MGLMKRHARAMLALCAFLFVCGCSEKPFPNVLVWDFAKQLPVRRASLTGVAIARDEIVIVGHDRPEGAVVFNPLGYVKSGGVWTFRFLPAPAVGGSIQMAGATDAEDGSVWACGRSADSELDPSRFFPVVYHYQGGVWTDVPVTGVAGTDDMRLVACAAHGSGQDFELRIVGAAQFAGTGVALRYHGGLWQRDPLPDPSAQGNGWELAALARARDGTWFAVGRILGDGGAVLLRDNGSGWHALAVPGGYPSLGFTGIGFDGEGAGWITGNYAAGDSTQGALFRYADGSFTQSTITRKSGGIYQLYGISLDVEGHGWAVGGRSGYLPFLAGSDGDGRWVESLGEIDPQDLLPGSTETFGGDLFASKIVAPDNAVSVGYKSVVDFKGLLESEVIIYERIPRPPGEIDSRTPPTAPIADR
jgi:hypothetical protein